MPAKKATARAPWKRGNPRARSERTTLTEASKAKAKARAKRAGRSYPNLVDNMWAAAEQKKGSPPSARNH